MKILPVLLTYGCIGLICLSLSACSTRSGKSAFRSSGASHSGSIDRDEDISVSEPEESAQEELEALNRPGAWEYGTDQRQIMKELGIDPSKYDFPITVNKQVMYYLELFQGKQRNYFSQWLARSTIYRPFIEAELKKAGLPLDLVYLAMIESGYNPSAYSPADACGLWQFIEGTGRTYGLKIDNYIDERREPEKATRAAARYLARLYQQFGDWYLAVAAYNAGERRIDTAMSTYNTKDFWEIAASEGIVLETKRYVPKLIAAIIIARDPEKYGFTDISYRKPTHYEIVTVPGGIDLEAVAATANVTAKELKALNNELRKGQTPPKIKEYALRVPAGTKELIAGNLDKLRPVSTLTYLTHTVKKGDTLTAICEQYNISKTTLLKANNLRSAQLKNGVRLRIPTTTTKYVLAKNGDGPGAHLAKVETKGRERKNQGSRIAALPEAAIAKAPGGTKAVAGKTAAGDVPSLAVTSKRNAEKVSGNKAPKTAARLASADRKTTKPIWYVVRSGDTLWTIAKKFQTSPEDLRALNKLSLNKSLQTGDKLLVKKG